MRFGKKIQFVLPALVIFNQATFAQDISNTVTPLPSPYAMATLPFAGVAPSMPVPAPKITPTRVAPVPQAPVQVAPASARLQVVPVKKLAPNAKPASNKKSSKISKKATVSAIKKPVKAENASSTKTEPLPAVGNEFIDPLTGISTHVITKAQSVPNNPEAKTVALTFDDGPSPTYTKQILAILKENQIHATFCVVGRQVKLYPEMVQQIVAEGHKIANHSMNHDESVARKPAKKIKTEVFAENELILSCAPDAKIEYFRAPAGNWNMKLRKMSASWGMKALGWSIDTKDWQHPGADYIVNHVTKYIHSGGVVLMHDGGGDRSESVTALKRMIPLLKAAGYQFTFPE